MKKLIYGCVLILSVLLFQLQFDQFNQKIHDSYRDAAPSYLNTNEKYATKTIVLEASHNKDTLTTNRLLRDRLLQYAKEHRYYLTFMLGESKNNVFKAYNFIYDPFDKFMDEKYIDNSRISFKKVDQERYYSTNLNDEKAIHFRYLNPDFYNELLYSNIEIHNILHENEVFREQSSIVFVLKFNKEKRNVVTNDLSDIFDRDKISVKISDRDNIDESIFNYQEVNNDMKYVMFFLLLMYIVLMVLYIINKGKEVTIRKIHGNRFFTLFKRVIFPCIFISSCLFILMIFLLYIVRIHYFGKLGLEFLTPILQTWLFFSIASFMGGICILYFMRFVSPLAILKNSANYKIIYASNYFFKFLVFVIFTAPILEQIVQLYPLYNAMQSGYKYEEFYRDYSYINFFDYRKFELDNNSSISNIKSGYPKKIYDVYNQFNELGALYADYSEVYFVNNDSAPKKYANIYVNKHYYDQFPLQDDKGNKFKYTTDNVTMFVPEKWKRETDNLICDGVEASECNVQFIENDLHYEIVDVLNYFEVREIKDAVITIFDKAPEKNQYPISPDQLYIKTDSSEPTNFVKEKTKELDIGKVDAEKVQGRIQDLRVITWHEIKLITIKIFVYFIVLFTFMYQSIFLFFYHRKLELAIRYLNGNSYIKRYRELFVSNMLLYVSGALTSALVFYIKWQSLIIFIILCLVFDLIISSFMIKNFERKSITSILKGEE